MNQPIYQLPSPALLGGSYALIKPHFCKDIFFVQPAKKLHSKIDEIRLALLSRRSPIPNFSFKEFEFRPSPRMQRAFSTIRFSGLLVTFSLLHFPISAHLFLWISAASAARSVVGECRREEFVIRICVYVELHGMAQLLHGFNSLHGLG